MASWRRLALAGAATSPITVNAAINGTAALASSLNLGDVDVDDFPWFQRLKRVNFLVRWGRTRRSLSQAIGRLTGQRKASSGPGAAETGSPEHLN